MRTPKEILPKDIYISERKNQYARIVNLAGPGYLTRHCNTPSTLAPKLASRCDVAENHIESGPLSKDQILESQLGFPTDSRRASLRHANRRFLFRSPLVT